MKNKNYSRRRPGNRPLRTQITVTAEECHGNADKMVRRFIKKAKKEGVVDEIRERQYYKSPSQRRIEKKRNRDRVIKKHNLRMKELFK